jgi:hypothetical protein
VQQWWGGVLLGRGCKGFEREIIMNETFSLIVQSWQGMDIVIESLM